MLVSRHPENGICTITLVNTGGGTALGTTFIFVSGSSAVRGFVGILDPGRRVILKTDPMPDVSTNPAGGFVSCFEDDERNVVQSWFLTNTRRRYRKRPWREVPSDDEMFADEYPDISLDGREAVAVHTPMLAQP